MSKLQGARGWLIVVVGILVPTFASTQAAEPTYYEMDDLGPLGGPPSGFDLPGVPNFLIRCLKVGVNGINSKGQVLSNRLLDDVPVVMVDEQILPTAFPPAYGCHISDDGFVAGFDARGAALWHDSKGTFEAYTSVVAPWRAETSRFYTGRRRLNPGTGIWAAGTFSVAGAHGSYLGSLVPDLTELAPEFEGFSIPNFLVTTGDGNDWIGGFLQSASGSFHAYWYGLHSLAGYEIEGIASTMHAVSREGILVGCELKPNLRSTMSGPPLVTIRKDGACLVGINNSDVAVGYYEGAGGLREHLHS